MRQGGRIGGARRDRWQTIAAVVLCCVLVPLMAGTADATEKVILPLPAPIQGALTAGPYNFQFTGEDNLRLTVWNSLTGCRVSCHYRTAPTSTTTQANTQTLAPTAARDATTKEFSVGPGYLLNVTILVSSGAPLYGQTFVKLQVIRGLGANAIVLGTVLQGYVTANQDLGWPGSPIQSSLDGNPTPRTVAGTTPAVGTDFFDLVPTGATWELLMIRGIYQASAVVGNRSPFLKLSLSGATFLNIEPQYNILANQLSVQYWAQGLNASGVGNLFVQNITLPARPILRSGSDIQTQTVGMDAGDAWSSIVYDVREWLEAP